MLRKSNQPLGPILAGMLQAFLFGLFFAPSELQASCGTYVVIGQQANAPSRPVSAPLQTTTHERIPTSPQDGRPKPCSGLMCSGSSDSDPVIPARIAPDRGNETAILASRFPVPPSVGRTAWRANSTLRPIRRAAEIEHPPRLPFAQLFVA